MKIFFLVKNISIKQLQFLTWSSLSGPSRWLKAIYNIFCQKLRPANHIWEKQGLTSFAVCWKETVLDVCWSSEYNIITNEWPTNVPSLPTLMKVRGQQAGYEWKFSGTLFQPDWPSQKITGTELYYKLLCSYSYLWSGGSRNCNLSESSKEEERYFTAEHKKKTKTHFQTLLEGLALAHSLMLLSNNVNNIRLPSVAKIWSDIVHSALRLYIHFLN